MQLYPKSFSLLLSVLVAFGLSKPIIANELYVHFPLDGDEVDTANGLFDGQRHNGPFVARGAVDSALMCDGQDDYVTFPDLGILDGQSNWTIEFWFWPKDIQTLSSIIDFHGEAKLLVQMDSGEVVARAKIGGDWRNLSTPVAQKKWHHLSYRYSTTAGTRLIVNGKLVGSDPTVGAIEPEEDETLNRICSYFRDNQWYDGRVDDVKVYLWD